MSKDSKKPAIRFKGFTDDWEQRKLNELAEFNPKCNLPNSFEYVDLESVVGTEMISSRYEIKENAPSRAQRLAKKGDVFYQTVRPYQRNNYLFDKEENNYVFSTGYAQLRPNCNSRYLLNLLQTDSFVNIVLNNCTGTSYPAINSSDLGNIHVTTTKNIREQTKIGEIFYRLDNLITLHQRKLDKLKNIKKALLEKMFPRNGENIPEVRFKGFSDDWEQRKFKEIAIVRRGLTYSPKDVSSQGVRVLRSSNIEGEFFLLNNDDVFVNSEVVKIEYVKRGDILITAANGSPKLVGKHAIIDSTSSDLPMVHGGFMLVASSNFSDFLNASMGSFWYSSFLKRNVTGGNGAIGNLSKADLDEVTILLPSDNEKIKIVSFFKNLYNLITLHQRKLDKLKNIKKALLEKMFV